MTEMTKYAPGTPSWVDLSARDIEAAAAFYGDLLGWEVPERENSAEMGGYRRAESVRSWTTPPRRSELRRGA